MEKPKKSSLFKRVATALVLAPLTIALIYAGSPWINVLALVFGAMLSWEWAHMVPNRNAPFLCDGLHGFPVGGRSVELFGSRRGGCRRCVIAGLV